MTDFQREQARIDHELKWAPPQPYRGAWDVYIGPVPGGINDERANDGTDS
jgi:hypothetical protein